ncbi:SDR family NAD(P)-dependent oxidoreductase [Flavobacterium sp. '19STA2R22 D10 B1']|uniref:SDR family NAD(P)-dependent oxidoreductase n=1 Tax=Flavobacterium aerium TaxID=3037261 RepID=UPI00278C8466|nr:SDR family NAD(P)-dependent oxidoreductase [Flavobacterium sp. '19STA2R22 D10 B1']
MKKAVIIIGAGTGLSKGIAHKFGKENYTIGLISRNAENLKKLQTELAEKGIESFYATADAHHANELTTAIEKLKKELGGIDVLVYNVANIKHKDILEETSDTLVNDFTLNVANALHSLQCVHNDLKDRKGAFLLSGGGLSLFPHSQYGSLAIGKASIRNLAFQLNKRLKPENIFVGTVTIAGSIEENSKTHSPAILANKFWELLQHRSEAEIQH